MVHALTSKAAKSKASVEVTNKVLAVARRGLCAPCEWSLASVAGSRWPLLLRRPSVNGGGFSQTLKGCIC